MYTNTHIYTYIYIYLVFIRHTNSYFGLLQDKSMEKGWRDGSTVKNMVCTALTEALSSFPTSAELIGKLPVTPASEDPRLPGASCVHNHTQTHTHMYA